MSNTFYQKKSELEEKLTYAKADFKMELKALDNKAFYSRRQIRNLEKHSLMMAACALALGYLISEIVHHL